MRRCTRSKAEVAASIDLRPDVGLQRIFAQVARACAIRRIRALLRRGAWHPLAGHAAVRYAAVVQRWTDQGNTRDGLRGRGTIHSASVVRSGPGARSSRA